MPKTYCGVCEKETDSSVKTEEVKIRGGKMDERKLVHCKICGKFKCHSP